MAAVGAQIAPGASLPEVVEHLDPSRLASFERVVFSHARPATVVLTTPNVEYNVRFEHLPAGSHRHRDHRFEWTRQEFDAWAGDVARRNGYELAISGIGATDAELGSPCGAGVRVGVDIGEAHAVRRCAPRPGSRRY